MCVVLLGMLAFSVDLGYVLSAREELQRTADASAIAACWELGQQLSDQASLTEASVLTRQTAELYSSQNRVTNQNVSLDLNASNNTEGDVVVGYIADFLNPASVLDTSNPNKYNAVRVRAHKNSNLNGEVPYYFANVFGLRSQALQTEALAGFVRDVAGFQIPANGSNIMLLPFALDLHTYEILIEQIAAGPNDTPPTNVWAIDSDTGLPVNGYDNLIEVNLYPQGTDSPGNRGTVDIGSSNNSTADIARQILHGVNATDLAVLGGEIRFDNAGELKLNGDTGISAGFKDELSAIRGQPRCIPIFSEVNGPGNTAVYTIVKWCGIRIMDVKLTGPMTKKHVTIQVGPIICAGVIPSTTAGTSDHVYSTVVLIE